MHHSIEIENLSFKYPDGHQALRDVCLHIEPCEKVALVGPNGAGKSTLILHLNGILTGEGDIHSAGLVVKKENLERIRARIGLVFQSPEDQLFSPTVFDDVAFGPMYQGLPEDEVQARVFEALEVVGMGEYGARVSHHLSLGEKKRIAIATVLSMTPEVLVLDEPTSNLDPRSKWSLIELLRQLPMTKVIAAHDLELVSALCQRTIILDEARIVAESTTTNILNDIPLLKTHGLAPQEKAIQAPG